MANNGESVFSAKLIGKYNWELLFDIDNSDNDGVIRRQEEVKTLVVTNYSEMKRSLESESTATSMGMNLGGTLFQVLNVNVEGNVSNEIKSSYETLVEYKKEQRKETSKTETYEVGPRSKLKLYRLVFNGPGVHCVTDTLSSTPDPKEEVEIAVKLRQVPVLQDIQVVYTNDSVSRPDDTIQMAHGDNPDINAGHKGEYVWLVPKWTMPVQEGATSLEIVTQGSENSQYSDLAKGAGGDYRYIKMLHHTNSTERITKIGLYRTDTDTANDNPLDKGWQYKSIDINRGRKGDYIYLVWNTQSADDFF